MLCLQLYLKVSLSKDKGGELFHRTSEECQLNFINLDKPNQHFHSHMYIYEHSRMHIMDGNVAISRKGITGQLLYGAKFVNDCQ